MSLEPFLADQAAEMIGLALISDLELSSVFIQEHAADRVPKHLLWSIPQGKIVSSTYYG
jgi:hypothetical protein